MTPKWQIWLSVQKFPKSRHRHTWHCFTKYFKNKRWTAQWNQAKRIRVTIRVTPKGIPRSFFFYPGESPNNQSWIAKQADAEVRKQINQNPGWLLIQDWKYTEIRSISLILSCCICNTLFFSYKTPILNPSRKPLRFPSYSLGNQPP